MIVSPMTENTASLDDEVSARMAPWYRWASMRSVRSQLTPTMATSAPASSRTGMFTTLTGSVLPSRRRQRNSHSSSPAASSSPARVVGGATFREGDEEVARVGTDRLLGRPAVHGLGAVAPEQDLAVRRRSDHRRRDGRDDRVDQRPDHVVECGRARAGEVRGSIHPSLRIHRHLGLADERNPPVGGRRQTNARRSESRGCRRRRSDLRSSGDARPATSRNPPASSVGRRSSPVRSRTPSPSAPGRPLTSRRPPRRRRGRGCSPTRRWRSRPARQWDGLQLQHEGFVDLHLVHREHREMGE